MTWTVPTPPVVHELLIADEAPMLHSWLTMHRANFLMRCAGLTGEQLAERAVPPSPLSLLGLVRHLTDVERTWFRRRLAGQDVPPVNPGEDSCFEQAVAERAEDDYRVLIAEWHQVDQALSGTTPDDSFTHERYGKMSLRWLYAHMNSEYAGHIGHADLLRERIDGVTFS